MGSKLIRLKSSLYMFAFWTFMLEYLPYCCTISDSLLKKRRRLKKSTWRECLCLFGVFVILTIWSYSSWQLIKAWFRRKVLQCHCLLFKNFENLSNYIRMKTNVLNINWKISAILIAHRFLEQSNFVMNMSEKGGGQNGSHYFYSWDFDALWKWIGIGNSIGLMQCSSECIIQWKKYIRTTTGHCFGQAFTPNNLYVKIT